MLFAAGLGKALIVEKFVPGAVGRAPQNNPNAESQHLLSPCNAQSYASAPAAAEEPCLALTQVSRIPAAAASRAGNGNAVHPASSTGWHASRHVLSFSDLTSVLQGRGDFVYFLARSVPGEAAAGGIQSWPSPRSAQWIGRSLGIREADLEGLRVAGIVRELHEPHSGDPWAGEIPDFPSGPEKAPFGCILPDCEQPAAATLLAEGYCLPHFITACYERLARCSEQPAPRPATEASAQQMRSFLTECAEQCAKLLRGPALSGDYTRARLTDIRYTALELRRKLRRSLRVADARAVRLVCETPGRFWSEETRTLLISRFGAMMECEHLVRPDDRLFLERKDTGCRARVRMVWRRPGRRGYFAVAVEFLDADNFWGLEWDHGVEYAPCQSSCV